MKQLFITLALLMTALSAFPQDKSLSLDEVVVTATKSDKKQSETGRVTTVITAEELKRSEGRSLGEVLNNQPGITINGVNGSPGSNQSVYLRGAADGYALIMIDGVVVYDPSQITNHFDLNLIPVDMIDHIEIVRGAASTLYGSGAVAGVINIITKKGGSKPFGLSAAFTGGSYNTFKENVGVYGKARIIDYQVNFTNFNSKGFSAAIDTTGKGNFDKDGLQQRAVNTDFGIHITDRFVIKPFFRYSYEKGDLDAGPYADDKYYTYDTKYLQTGLHTVYSLPGGDFHFIYSFNNTKRNYLDDTAAGKTNYYRESDNSQLQVADAYFNYNISDKVQLLTGTSYTFSSLNQSSLYIVPGYSAPGALSDDSTRVILASVYASLFIKHENGFNLEAGGRLNNHSVYGANPTFTFNPFYSFHGRHKIFVNIGSTFNAPSLYQLYSPYGNKALKPEKGISYEAGFETLVTEKLKLRVTGFKRDMKDVIAFGTKYINYNKQNDYGAEVEAEYACNDRFTLKGYYAYVNGKVTAQNGNKDTSYDNLFKRPHHTFGINAGYQLTPAFFVGTDLKYTGQRNDLQFDPVTYAPEDVSLHPYVLWNIHAGYALKEKFHFFIDLKNITNSNYMDAVGYATRRFNFDAGLRVVL